MSETSGLSRRNFIKTSGAVLGGTMLAHPILSFAANRRGNEKMKVALVGTGVRGVGMYGQRLLQDYGNYVDMVGICDQNPGRVKYAHDYIKPNGPAFTDLDEMLTKTRPEWLIVTTWDWEHHSCIIKGLQHGCNIMCEKPLTIDEHKAQMLLDARKKYGKEIIVTFNYRWAPPRAKLKELIMGGAIGDLTTVDFHWNISRSHQMRYMQRWHGEKDRGGSLWVHKSTHHFDLVNWWVDSDPEEVYAFAGLEQFGSNGPFRGKNCRNCDHTRECPYYWDITQNDHLNGLYAKNENFDGYIRDNCVFRHQIDSYDKHAAVVKYANNVLLNYSLTCDTNHSGFWIAFNGTKGRIEGREGGWPGLKQGEPQQWILQPIDGENEVIDVHRIEGGHWGGDPLMKNKFFVDPDQDDPLAQAAGLRDGVMSILPGIAARKSSETGQKIRIADLTSLQPMAKRPVSG